MRGTLTLGFAGRNPSATLYRVGDVTMTEGLGWGWGRGTNPLPFLS